MPGVMCCGVEAERLGKKECAPVSDSANDTEAGEDEGARCACDSETMEERLVGVTGS